MDVLMLAIRRYFLWILLFSNLIGCSLQPVKETPKAGIPVLYVPGFGESGKEHEKWPDLKKLFEDKGYDLRVARMPSVAPIEEGAEALLEEIKRHFPDKNIRFHIVAKSMGGLSARKALHESEKTDSMVNRVMSLSTISTPHLGTEIADYYLDKDNRDRCVIPRELTDPFFIMIEKLGFGENGLTEAGRNLTTVYMREVFNKTVRNVEGIEYFSFQYKIDCGSSLCNREKISWVNPYPTNPLSACWHNIIYRKAGVNDGVVSVESAMWGTPVGIYEGEHIAQTLRPSLLFPIFSKYKGEEIWQKVFERVLDNLNAQKLTHPKWP